MGAPLSLFDNDSKKLKSYATIKLTFGSWNLQISIHHFTLGPMACNHKCLELQWSLRRQVQ